MSKIYELPLSFRLVKKYIRFTFKRFYSEFIVLGKENIPVEGQVIFAPNHLNALMDALAVHSISPDNYATVFLARSDIFRKKVLARILRACKIMPAFRIRDGIENLGKNNEVFDKCSALLLWFHLFSIGFVDQHHDMVGFALTTRADALFGG